MLKKIFLLFIVCFSAIRMYGTQPSSGGAGPQINVLDIVAQNIAKMQENTELLQAYLRLPKEVAAAKAQSALAAEKKQLDEILAQAQAELQAEQDELNEILTFTRSIETTASLRRNIKNYDAQVIPNKIKSLYERK